MLRKLLGTIPRESLSLDLREVANKSLVEDTIKAMEEMEAETKKSNKKLDTLLSRFRITMDLQFNLYLPYATRVLRLARVCAYLRGNKIFEK